MAISGNDPNSAPKTFNNLDWTAAAATTLPTALSFYAFNAAANSKSTPSMLFHTTIGLLSLKYAYGFASAWRENKPETTRSEYIAKGIRNAEELGSDAKEKATSLYTSIINPPKVSPKDKFAALGKTVITQVKKAEENPLNHG